MGNYTVFKLDLRFRPDLDYNVINILKFMTRAAGSEDLGFEIPKHSLFVADMWPPAWSTMLCSSYTAAGIISDSCLLVDPMNGSYRLRVYSIIKNYENQIVKFLDWIHPYSISLGNVGFLHYEEYKHPAVIVFRDNYFDINSLGNEYAPEGRDFFGLYANLYPHRRE